MPNIGELIGSLVAFLADQFSASSLRLGPLPSLAVFGVVLVLLSLVARPTARWVVRDLGHLAGVARAMALAAESGAAATVSLGAAGVARAAAADQRMQTLAALSILGHVARAAARSGVPLRITANDPVAVHLAAGAVADAHRRTVTLERQERARAEYLGEGRAVSAGASLAGAGASATTFVVGGLGEEALLLLHGEGRNAAWTSYGTAAASQASSVLLESRAVMIGPELYQAASDLGAARHERSAVQAFNRVVAAVVVVLVAGSVAGWVTGFDLGPLLAGR
ncbi:MAG TPA: DUF6754 domain-containing protein [candidate division Zixibacteria bacterium]|nr:DUF6754 domain-containing protein [candidate division Zixibacteria bacterium]